MPDPDQPKPPTIFPGLLQQKKGYQINLDDLAKEFAVLVQAAQDPDSEVENDELDERLARLDEASGAALAERIVAAESALGPVLGEALRALTMRIELRLFTFAAGVGGDEDDNHGDTK